MMEVTTTLDWLGGEVEPMSKSPSYCGRCWALDEVEEHPHQCPNCGMEVVATTRITAPFVCHPGAVTVIRDLLDPTTGTKE